MLPRDFPKSAISFRVKFNKQCFCAVQGLYTGPLDWALGSLDWGVTQRLGAPPKGP
jgi:hypothetical protein